MPWTAPMTAVAGSVFTAAQFNTHIRDNLLETAPGKATAAGQHFVSNGVNSIIQRTANTATVATQQTTTSTSFTDLATVGPDLLSQTTGTKALVMITAALSNNTIGQCASMGYSVSGASSISADSSKSSYLRAAAANQDMRATSCILETGLTAGSNAFRAKYVVTGGTGAFANRDLALIPFS